ncbi:MAG: chloramphenicol phosphotransferase CPT family protein [Acidimicrobiia bacterium]
MERKARVVILNGASSAGKTTLATAFRDQRAAVGDFWLLTGIDDFLKKLPSEWRSVGHDRGAFAMDGLRFETAPEGLRVRVGRVGRQLLRAYQTAVGAAARVGLNVIVDDVVIDRTHWDDWNTSVAGLEVVWVGIRCAPDVAEERERTRGDDRYSGLARAQTGVVHRDAIYDFEIDTTTQTPAQALSALTRQLGY